MKNKFGVVAVLLGAAAGVAQADEAPYIGFDAVKATLSTSTQDASPLAVRARLGSEVTKYVGVETQALMGVKDESVDVTGGSMDIALKWAAGVYGRVNLPLGDVAAIYGLAGYSFSSIDATAHIPGVQDSDTFDSDFSAGAGIEIKLGKKVFISADYMQYTEGLTAFSAGFRIPL